MKKDAYYFSHDANAQDDPKCMHLIDELGWQGYGLFWALCERMRSQCDFMLPHSIVKHLAKRWNIDEIILKKVVSDFGLFETDDKHFWSERLKRSMEIKSEKARESANYRWSDANAMRTHSKRNANGMRIDAIKGKEKKKKKNVVFSPNGEVNTGYTLLPDGGYSGPNDKGQPAYFDDQGRELDHNGNPVAKQHV